MSISVLGIYVADLVFFGKKIPVEGETILGNNFVIGPGGKGSNQAVAAAKAGVKAIVQPGGSIKDDEVIQACDEHGISMIFVGVRHFKH